MLREKHREAVIFTLYSGLSSRSRPLRSVSQNCGMVKALPSVSSVI